MRRRWPALALTLALAPASVDANDVMQPTRSELLVERSHTAVLTMAADRATLRVRRTVHNGGPRHDQAVFWINVPETAVATGLRTMATVKGRPVWYDGELMEAEAAAAKYQELTGIGGYYPKDPALLSWRQQGFLALQVFPCPPGEDKTVEYTLSLPVEYVAGRSQVRLPRLGSEAMAAEIRVRAADRRDQILINGSPVGTGARVRWPEAETSRLVLEDAELVGGAGPEDEPVDDRLIPDEGSVLIALRRQGAPRLDGRVASVALVGGERHLREFEIDAAPRLGEAPRGAHVVVVVDASRSLGDEEVAAELAAARAYLAGFPDAKVEVVAFARQADPVFGRFVDVDAARGGLEGLALARRNGSDVDLALARAGELLRRAPKGAPRRVLLLTDTMTRASITPERLRGALASTGALVHVGVPAAGAESEVERDDAHAWAPAVRATGGLVWAAAIDVEDGARAERRRRAAFEEWVRPLRIDHVRVAAPGLGEGDLDVPESLDEGEGIRDLRIGAAALPWVRVEGELWAAPVREVFARDPDHGRLWSALVFGSELLGELSEPEMMALAFRGGAVSPVTSYLAIEPGVRPSTEGLEEEEGIGLGGIGLIGTGRGGGGSGYGRVAPPDPRAWILAETRRLREACGAPSFTLTFESTLDEVVAVGVAGRAGAMDPVSARCVEEGVWAWALPGSFVDRWKRYEVVG